MDELAQGESKDAPAAQRGVEGTEYHLEVPREDDGRKLGGGVKERLGPVRELERGERQRQRRREQPRERQLHRLYEAESGGGRLRELEA